MANQSERGEQRLVDGEAVLMGQDFDVAPGERVAFCGFPEDVTNLCAKLLKEKGVHALTCPAFGEPKNCFALKDWCPSADLADVIVVGENSPLKSQLP